jgi:hypothetical protein
MEEDLVSVVARAEVEAAAETRPQAFTPGPWVYGPLNCVWQESTLKGGDPVIVTSFSGFNEREIADAHLIAAAPELFDVAVQCAALAERWGEQGPLVQQARAAIAKALGGGVPAAPQTEAKPLGGTQ